MKIRKARACELPEVSKLANLLWPDSSVGELFEEFRMLFQKKNDALFVAIVEKQIIAFAHSSIRREYVEGTKTNPVGYLEGIYVSPAVRKQRIGTLLLKKCEEWAKEQGCFEFASDCELGNMESFSFHLKVGFEEANRIICFVKKL